MKCNGHVLMLDGITPHVSATLELLKLDWIIDVSGYYRILEVVEGNY